MNQGGQEAAAPLVVFDGDCGFCQRCVAFAQARDRRRLTFVAWQDAGLDAEMQARARSSVLWLHQGRVLDESAAVVRVLWSLHVGWKAAAVLAWLVPRPLRDAGYRWAGRKWGPLGSKSACAPDATGRQGPGRPASDGRRS